MYQRDIDVPVICLLFCNETQQELDDPAERAVEGEKEHGEQHRHQHDHYGRRHRLAAGRPNDLLGLGLNLADKFTGGCACHVSMLQSETDSLPAPHVAEWVLADVAKEAA